ncbi:MAG: TraB/GumN family protein [Alphaproteobacteria bacterium]|nr:TraB/GumN family protein [Alphaproteobacteria bacterium]MCZ6846580.1 TraB/GumN family protein [Alphaproteobacteria bacterium]
MRQLSLVLSALVWLWTPPASGDEPRAYAEGLLWRIESPTAPPSYVFGTIHITDARVQSVVKNMLNTVGPLDSISLEIIQTPAAMVAAAQRMFTLNGPGLSQRLGPQLYDATLSAAVPYGLNANVLERFKPWALAVTLSLPLSELRAQAAGQLNSEKIIEAHAAKNQIALHAIETIDEQLSLFDGLSETKQVEMLRLAVHYSGVTNQIFSRLVNDYLAQDLESVYRIMEEFSVGQRADLQEFYESELIAGRNRRMVERIQPRLAEGRALIAVGALHLPDEVGVLRLLEKRGFTIKRMSVSN